MRRLRAEMNQKETAAYDYMLGLLVVIQDMKQRTNKLEEESDKLTKNFEALKDAKSMDASTLYLYLSHLVSDYHLADLHLDVAEKRVNNLMKILQEKEKEVEAQ